MWKKLGRVSTSQGLAQGLAWDLAWGLALGLMRLRGWVRRISLDKDWKVWRSAGNGNGIYFLSGEDEGGRQKLAQGTSSIRFFMGVETRKYVRSVRTGSWKREITELAGYRMEIWGMEQPAVCSVALGLLEIVPMLIGRLRDILGTDNGGWAGK